MQDRKPLIELTTEGDEQEVEKEEFFSIDGVMYYIPVECPPYLAMYYLNQLRDGSSDRATLKVMDEMIGQKGVRALAKCKTMTPPQLKQIIGILQEKIYDVMEQTTGN